MNPVSNREENSQLTLQSGFRVGRGRHPSMRVPGFYFLQQNKDRKPCSYPHRYGGSETPNIHPNHGVSHWVRNKKPSSMRVWTQSKSFMAGCTHQAPTPQIYFLCTRGNRPSVWGIGGVRRGHPIPQSWRYRQL